MIIFQLNLYPQPKCFQVNWKTFTKTNCGNSCIFITSSAYCYIPIKASISLTSSSFPTRCSLISTITCVGCLGIFRIPSITVLSFIVTHSTIWWITEWFTAFDYKNEICLWKLLANFIEICFCYMLQNILLITIFLDVLSAEK